LGREKKQGRILYLNEAERTFFDDNYIKFSKFLHDLLFEVISLKKENKDAIHILRGVNEENKNEVVKLSK